MIASIGAFFGLITSLPQVLAVLLELKTMWETYLDEDRRKEAMGLLGDALNAATTQKDTTQLTALVNNIIANKPLK